MKVFTAATRRFLMEAWIICNKLWDASQIAMTRAINWER
jgi:hypothetical protein